MKVVNAFLTAIALILCTQAPGQDKRVYSTTILEFPFTWSNATDNGEELTGPVRFWISLNIVLCRDMDFTYD